MTSALRGAALAIALAGSACAVGTGCSADPAPPGQTQARARLPGADLVALSDGSTHTLDTVVSGLTVLNLWASYCTPCRTEMPELQGVADRWAGRVAVIGVTDDVDLEVARSAAAATGVRYPLYQNAAGQLLQGLGVANLPATFVVDAQGDIVFRKLGRVSAAELDAALAPLAGQPGPSS